MFSKRKDPSVQFRTLGLFYSEGASWTTILPCEIRWKEKYVPSGDIECLDPGCSYADSCRSTYSHYRITNGEPQALAREIPGDCVDNFNLILIISKYNNLWRKSQHKRDLFEVSFVSYLSYKWHYRLQAATLKSHQDWHHKGFHLESDDR